MSRIKEAVQKVNEVNPEFERFTNFIADIIERCGIALLHNDHIKMEIAICGDSYGSDKNTVIVKYISGRTIAGETFVLAEDIMKELLVVEGAKIILETQNHICVQF